MAHFKNRPKHCDTITKLIFYIYFFLSCFFYNNSPLLQVPSMTDTQIDTRTAVDLVKMRMGNELGLHLDQLGVPVNVVVWQMILPLFISKGTTVAALRLLDVIFFEGSSLAVSVYINTKWSVHSRIMDVVLL